MDRLFHHKVGVGEIGGIIIVAAAAFYCFWQRQSIALIVLGLVLIVVAVMMIDRALHTEYTITEGGELIISEGRFARKKTINIVDITRLSIMPLALHLGSYLLIEVKGGMMKSISPVNAEEMMKKINKIKQNLK